MASFLVLDDDATSGDALVAALRTAGHDAETVATGWELLERLGDDESVVDLVIGDTRIAFPDGLTVATLARAAGVRAPFLLRTRADNQRAKKVAAGVADVVLLEPPADQERVLDAALRLLDRDLVVEPRWVGVASDLLDNDGSTD